MNNNTRIIAIVALLLAGVVWYFGWGPGNERISPWTKANFYYTIGSYERAIDAYTQAIDQNPSHVDGDEAVYRIARSYQILERHDEALVTYELFVDAYPNHRRVGDAKTQISKYQMDSKNR